MKFESVLKHLGPFGRYQKWQMFLLALPTFVTAMHAISFVFTGATPTFRCRIPGFDDVRNSTCHLNETVPINSDKGTPDTCKRYDYGKDGCAFKNSNDSTQPVIGCGAWIYDESVYKTSLTVQWNLVCDDIYLKAIAQSLYMFGMLTGAVIFGDLSDRFGRKKAFMGGLILQFVCGILSAFAPEYITFVILRFLLGNAHSGSFLPAFVITMEFVGPKYKIYGGLVPNSVFAVGFCTLGLLAYFIRYWNWLQLAITAPGILFLSYWWLVSESARWLLQKGRPEEAKEIILKAAKMNGVTIPEKVLEEDEEDTIVHNATAIDLLTYGPRLRRNSFIVFYNWFVVSMLFYGLSFSTSDLPGGNPFLKVALSGIVEFGGFLFCWVFMNRIGRKWCQCSMMISAGVTCIAAGYVPVNTGYNWLIQVLAYTGKAASGAGFVLVYNLSGELFPTIARNAGVGISSMSARIGSTLTPFISLLGHYTELYVTLTIFGGLSLLAGLSVLFLPETNTMPIPETLEDAENLGRTEPKEKEAAGNVFRIDQTPLREML